MPRGYRRAKHPEMYKIAKGIAEKIQSLQKDRYSEYYNDSMPFLMKAWNRYLIGEYDKEKLFKVVGSLAAIWEHKS
jgi:hypothetical protein